MPRASCGWSTSPSRLRRASEEAEAAAGTIRRRLRVLRRTRAREEGEKAPSVSEHAAKLAQAAKAIQACGDDADAHAVVSSLENITYRELVGYDETVKLMRDFGVGMQHDERFQELVELLNARHGLDRMPASDARCSVLRRARTRTDSWRPRWASWGCRPSACTWRRTFRGCRCCASWRRPTASRSSTRRATPSRARACSCWRTWICGCRP